MRSFFKNNALRLCGVFIFVLILTQIDVASALNVISGSDKGLLIISILLIIPLFLAKSLKWYYLLNIQGLRYSFAKVTSMYMAGFFLGATTPAKIGEFGKVLFLKKENHSYGRLFFSILTDRLSDLILLFILCTVGIFFFGFSMFEVDMTRVLFFLTVSTVLLLVIFFKRNDIKGGLKKIFERFITKGFRNDINLNTIGLLNEFRVLSIRRITLTSFLTCLAYAIHFVHLYIAALGLGINISFFYLSVSMSIVMIVNSLPISFMGIGTRDLALIVLFSNIDISREMAVALSSTMLFFVIIGIVLSFPFFLSMQTEINVKYLLKKVVAGVKRP